MGGRLYRMTSNPYLSFVLPQIFPLLFRLKNVHYKGNWQNCMARKPLFPSMQPCLLRQFSAIQNKHQGLSWSILRLRIILVSLSTPFSVFHLFFIIPFTFLFSLTIMSSIATAGLLLASFGEHTQQARLVEKHLKITGCRYTGCGHSRRPAHLQISHKHTTSTCSNFIELRQDNSSHARRANPEHLVHTGTGTDRSV